MGPGQEGSWRGLAGYSRIAITGSFSLALRGELFEDKDGVRTGVAQRLTEATVTPELRLTPHLLVRGDLRVDRSSRPIFEKLQRFSKTQPTALLNGCYSF